MGNGIPPRADSADRWANITFAALAVAFVAALFNHGFVPSMEPRFAEVVREMMANGEWTIPTKNGVPYVEYPVFYYWLAIAGRLLHLPMAAAIRLPTFIAFFAWLYVLGRWQRYWPTTLPARAFQIVGAALPVVLFQFSIAQTDGLLAFGVLLAMCGYTRLMAEPTSKAFPWMLWSGVTIATLAKGPVGMACTLPVFFLDRLADGLSSARRNRSGTSVMRAVRVAFASKSVCWIRGSGLVLIISAPWYVLTGINRDWTFVQAVLVYQNFDRYVTGYSHSQPWWYYLKTLVYDAFPLSAFLPIGIWAATKRSNEAVVRATLIWAIFTFLFFSVSGSKQGKYLLPMSPSIIALSLMAVEHIGHTSGRELWRWLRGWSIGLVLTFCAAMTFVIPFYSGEIGGVDGFRPIRAQIEREPGRLVHFQWPRSLTLYELGAPLPFVRSARELYSKIASGELRPGDYVLVQSNLLGDDRAEDAATRLLPFPRPEVFDVVLESRIEKPVTLLRVVRGAASAAKALVPETPDPPSLNWREAMFDTD